MKALDKEVKVLNILRTIDFPHDTIDLFEFLFASPFFLSLSSESSDVELIIILTVKAYIFPFYFIFSL